MSSVIKYPHRFSTLSIGDKVIKKEEKEFSVILNGKEKVSSVILNGRRIGASGNSFNWCVGKVPVVHFVL